MSRDILCLALTACVILRGQSNVDSEQAGVTEQEEGRERVRERQHDSVPVCAHACESGQRNK